MLSYKYLCRYINRFKADKSGQIGIWFAILALPMLIMTTFVLDYTRAEQVKNELSNALDDAAIAAVLKQNLTVAERAVFAEDYFWHNFADNANFKLHVIDSSAERVELNSSGVVPTTIIHSLGKKDINVQDSAVSELTKHNVICVLALAPDSQRAFAVSEGAEFNAPTCSVQVNSTHNQAAFVDSNSRAFAKAFCTVGGASGSFLPYANTECSVVEDPYKDLQTSASGPCINETRVQLKSKGGNEVGDRTLLYPGTYCGGLIVSGIDVSFKPGEYIILDGPLVFTKGSSAIANDVTFIMRGKRSTLNITKGSSLKVKAPSSGPLAGLAFFQDTHALTDKKPRLPNGSNLLGAVAGWKHKRLQHHLLAIASDLKKTRKSR